MEVFFEANILIERVGSLGGFYPRLFPEVVSFPDGRKVLLVLEHFVDPLSLDRGPMILV